MFSAIGANTNFQNSMLLNRVKTNNQDSDHIEIAEVLIWKINIKKIQHGRTHKFKRIP